MALIREALPGPGFDFVLILGGSNALGAFQAGVYEAFREAGFDRGHPATPY